LSIGDGKLTGDLHVYKHAPDLEYFYEIAERTPDLIGLSAEFSGVPEEKNGKRFARCDEILSVMVVDIPAANPTGLFAVDGAGTVEYRLALEEMGCEFAD